ncbi:MAG: IS66 family insertion sequence element accessory protein TnpB [SAR324 cluster bacterium]|nr:IS66 family insertion sequence element accessory protein TnpB [SAR324 cluster bacterium]
MIPELIPSVYLVQGPTDFRKSWNGLSAIVMDELEVDLFSGGLFVFCNRKRSQIRILYWERNGFCLWAKRLEKDKFPWPESQVDTLQIEHHQLNWLLNGISIIQKEAHSRLNYRAL